jgi:large subunit ribosomal protein L25
VIEGGVLSQDTREVNIEALPGDIPDTITHDVSGMQINDTLTLASVTVPDGITLLDDLDETVIATITPPTVETESDDIEVETVVIGGDGAKAEGDTAEEAADSAADSDDKS